MAINKSNTSPFVKVVIIFFSVVLVFGIAGGALVPLLQSINAPTRSNTGVATTTVDTTATLQAKYTQRVAVVEAEITKDPKNYDMLIAQAEAYQQWAADVQQATNKVASPDDTPLWLKSLSYFKRAAAVKKLDSATRTNMAIAQFYSGDPGKAIAMAQEIVKADPKFAPVHFNMGVFYTMTGNAAAGAAEYKAYLALDPKGEWAAEAQKRITDLNAQGASTPSSPGTGSLPTTP